MKKAGVLVEGQVEQEVIENQEITKEEEKGFGWAQFILFFVTFLGISIGIGVILGLFVASIELLTDHDLFDIMFSAHSTLIMDAVVFIIALLCFKKIRTFLKHSFSFAPFKEGKTYLYLIGSFIVIMLTQYLFISVLKLDDPTAANESFGADNLSSAWWSVSLFYFAFAILTPIKEEIMFRGIIHGFLAHKYRFWVGFLVSSIIFGVLHFGYPISATIMGIVFVLQYKLTKSLAVPIVFHIIWNAYAVTILLYFS